MFKNLFKVEGVEFNVIEPSVKNTLNKVDKSHIKEVLNSRPHVVILGAGATIATIPNGDKNGKKCSVMNNFLDELGLSDIKKSILEKDSQAPVNNIEYLYSYLAKQSQFSKLKMELEESIYSVMSNYSIPDRMTIYDWLILSLRGKDCVATFNWDPLIVQAYNRSLVYTDNLPSLLFLHGNVSIMYCKECGIYSPTSSSNCPQCGCKMRKSPLLFPIENKNYNNDPFIEGQWNTLLSYLEDAGMLTIFGYSGPKSDAKALRLMHDAFDNFSQRFNQVEIIDVKNEEELVNVWDIFAKPTNYHYKIWPSFWNSSIAEYPRRSIEGYVDRNIGGCWNRSTQQLIENADKDNIEMLISMISEEDK